MIGLGDRIKDRISGVTGIVTSVSDFLYGCRRLGLQPEGHKDGKPAESFWIDEPQAILLKSQVVKPAVVSADAPDEKPARRHGPRPDVRRAADARR